MNILKAVVFFLIVILNICNISSLPCTSRREKDCEKLCNAKPDVYLYCKMSWLGKVTCYCKGGKYKL